MKDIEIQSFIFFNKTVELAGASINPIRKQNFQ